MSVRFSLWLVVSVFCSPLFSTMGHASGEQQQRFAVELALVAGDSRLLTGTNLSAQKRRWIEQRVAASIKQLPLLARYFQQEMRKNEPDLDEKLKYLADFMHKPDTLAQQALMLSRQYPLKFSLLLPQKLTAFALKKTSTLYQSLCLGCHLGAAVDNSVVVGDFSSFAGSMNANEWLARLLGGLHGDAYTGLENPFTDKQIAMLFSYTRHHLAAE